MRRRHERVLLLCASILALILAASLSLLRSSTAGAESDLEVDTEVDRGGEMITVHGEWSLQVIDLDGHIAAAVEFTNDLTPVGARTLTSLLTGGASAGQWSVSVAGSSQQLCGAPPAACRLGAAAAEGVVGLSRSAGSSQSADSSQSVGSSQSAGSSAGSFDGDLDVRPLDGGAGFELSGEFEAMRSGSIDFVETYLTTCAPTSMSCAELDADALFTATGLESLPVRAGQIVEVVVAISFG